MDLKEHFIKMGKLDFLPELRNADIHTKTKILQDFMPQFFYSRSGLMNSLLLIDGEKHIRPMTEDEVRYIDLGYYLGDEHLDRLCNETEGMLYENSLTTAGIYLSSMTSRYRVTGEKAAMEEALRAYNSIRMVYDWGRQAGRPGHLSKPYGGGYTPTSTPDQYLFALTGLYWFYKLQDCPVKEEIRQIFIDCAEFCMARNYQVCYLTSWNMISETGAYNAIYTLIAFLAFMVSKEEKYFDEMNRVLSLGSWRTESYMGAWRRAGLKRMLMFERVCLAHFAVSPAEILFIECPVIFGETAAEQKKNMEHCVHEWWRFGALGVDENFYQNYWIDIDVDNFTWRSTGLTPLKSKEEMPKGQDYLFMRYHSDVKWSEQMYRQLHNSLVLFNYTTNEALKLEAKNWIMNILERTDGLRLRHLIDLDGKQLLPLDKHSHCILASETQFHYLNIYWRAREQGLI